MTEQKKPASRKVVDWEAVERDYRAGVLSLREIGTRAGITEGAIRKRAKADGWSRDLAPKIAAKADELVRKAEVRSQVRTGDVANERQTVEASAQAIATVRLDHRSDIRRARSLVNTLLEELEGQTAGRLELEELGELMRRPNDNGVDKLNDLYQKIISLSGRVTNVKSLSEALKNLIGLEREAWGLGLPEKPTNDPSDLSDQELAQRVMTLYGQLAGPGTAAE